MSAASLWLPGLSTLPISHDDEVRACYKALLPASSMANRAESQLEHTEYANQYDRPILPSFYLQSHRPS